MRRFRPFLQLFSLLAGLYLSAPGLSSPAFAAELVLESPRNLQVFQRKSKSEGTVILKGKLSEPNSGFDSIEIRLTIDAQAGQWQSIPFAGDSSLFNATFDAPAGGWHQLDLRLLHGRDAVSATRIEKFGIGEIFVIAGQSNSANYGEEKLTTKSGRVSVLAENQWQLSSDPQPGATGQNGSFIPPFGDALEQQLNVPIGIIACGIGATSVREWLPKGSPFAIPPTLIHRVVQRPDGTWESDGQAYEMLISRIKSLGPQGFRAVLWHQGESDANQKDATRTLPGKLYREFLQAVIEGTRRDAGWSVPWFVAQATYHVPGDEASPDIRAAQASLWRDTVALEGPDTDLLKGPLRDSNGQGVHFSGAGQREHGARWAEKVGPWVVAQTDAVPSERARIGQLPVQKILFLGNSITLHGPKADIGWEGNWGMAASTIEKDYVHLVTKEIARSSQSTPRIKVRNIADFERGFESYDAQVQLKDELAFQADLIILAIGENVPELTSDQAQQAYLDAYTRLLHQLKGRHRPTVLVRGSFWPNAIKDKAMHAASDDAGVTFIDISQLGTIEVNMARSERKIEHPGVAGHPGDRGMQEIANAILKAVFDHPLAKSQ